MTVIAALLTLVGYSMNDTIVVFDRIRENLKLVAARARLGIVINASINQTLSRTILTSGLTFLTALVAVPLRRPGVAWFFVRAGGGYYRRDLFVGLHCESDRDLLAQLRWISGRRSTAPVAVARRTAK